eukprot:146069_1
MPIVTNDTLNIVGNKLTFQLNYHKNTNNCDEIKKLCDERMVKFYIGARQFCKSSGSVPIQIYVPTKEYGNILKNCVKEYYKQHEIDKNIDCILKLIDEPQEIEINKSSYCMILKIKIAKLFDNIIDPKYIE